jgi:hypothetical protein
MLRTASDALYVVAERPADSIPTIVLDPVPLETTLTTIVRSLDVRGVPDGQFTPVRFTLDADVSVNVMSSTRQLDPIVRRVTLLVTFVRVTVTVCVFAPRSAMLLHIDTVSV